MSRLIHILLICCIFTLAQAQDYTELIHNNPAMAAANMMNYHFEEVGQTPAPKGYKAFYISHYGRHGSRYQTNDLYAGTIWPLMRKADSLHILSKAGKAFYKDFNAVMQEQMGMFGMLTGLGAKEQRGIAMRMAEQFPDVFQGRNGRKTVFCQSSTVPRCLISMNNFTHSLDRHTEGLDFTFITGQKYYDYLAHKHVASPAKELANAKEDSLRRAVIKPLELIDHFFADREKALELIGDPYSFEEQLYLASCVGQLTDYGVCLLSHFPTDILIRNWEIRNARFYLAYGMSYEMSEYQKEISRCLISDFIRRAEQAIKEDSNIAADIRFGHDTSLLPFIGHIGLKGTHEFFRFERVNSVWNSSVSICMASNIQMIFYRNKSGDILVKIMYNEKETTIPALKAVCGPYYKWSELEKHLKSLIPEETLGSKWNNCLEHTVIKNCRN